MYQQKFIPYNQINNIYEQQNYQEEDSEPLIEEVDPNYEPNERQVRQYAIEVLGMTLPEDERLLYLARQGLKAPIPTNWQPFQGRDGEVYYKHKITQQKTFEHPTDVEYRKKYIQEKERVARKNLKSMNLKTNPLSGLGQSFGQPTFGSLGSKINPLSNLSSEQNFPGSKQSFKLDPKLEKELQKQVEELQLKLKKEFEQFEFERGILHEKNMKKYRADFEQSLSELKGEKNLSQRYEKGLKQQKQRIKERLKQAYGERFKDQFLNLQRGEQKRLQQFTQLYEEDNKIKLKKYESQKERQYSERVKKIEANKIKHEEIKMEKEKQRQRIIKEIRATYQKEDNQEIQKATKETFDRELAALKEQNQAKIQRFQQKLNLEFEEMRKLLGDDPNKALQELAERKNRLKKISQQKIQSLKKKEYQKVAQNFTQLLEKQLEELKIILEIQNSKEIQNQKNFCNQKLKDFKAKYQTQIKEALSKKAQEIYSNVKKSTTEYEKTKNKQILQIRQKFISEIVEKNHQKSQELELKLSLKEKEQIIENKEQIIKSLNRQIELETFILKELIINKNIANSPSVDDQLKKIAAELNIVFKPDAFFKYQKKFDDIKQKYKADKQLLGVMMTQLQNTVFIPLYQQANRNKYQPNITSTTAALVKKYNNDVRTMRKNEQMLGKFEVILRKAELNDQTALKDLQNQQFLYEQISLKSKLDIERSNERELHQIDEKGESKLLFSKTSGFDNGFQSIEDRLKKHSKFLSKMKQDLNRKLYKVRSNHYFRV